MRIWAKGYRRNDDPHDILNKGVVDAVVEDEVSNRHERNLYLERNESDGSIILHIFPQELKLGGNYDLYVQLSEDDIVKLFLECFPDMRNVVTRVAQRSPAEPDKSFPIRYLKHSDPPNSERLKDLI
jgi:hypothetical protein